MARKLMGDSPRLVLPQADRLLPEEEPSSEPCREPIVGGVPYDTPLKPRPYDIVGAELSYPFRLSQHCVETVSAQLERPDGTPLAVDITVESTGAREGLLHFTPPESGLFHLKLRLEPGAKSYTYQLLLTRRPMSSS